MSSHIRVEIFGEVRACDLVLREALSECSEIVVETNGIVNIPKNLLPVFDEIAERHGCDVFEAVRAQEAARRK